MADSASTTDSNVNQNALLATPFTLDLATIREMKQQLVSINVLPNKNGRFAGAISPNVLGDIYNATTVNDSIVDFWKYSETDKFDKMAGSDQKMEIELPGTNVVFRQTPFVTKTANFSGAKTAYRTYIFGNYALIGVQYGLALAA